MKSTLSILSITSMVMALLFGSNMVMAAEEKEDKSPLGCKDVGYQYHLRALDILPRESESGQSLYFVFNRSDKPVRLYQMRDEQSADAMSLNHDIPAQRWAVLAVDAKLIRYACAVPDKKNEYGQLVDCAQTLKVCEFARVKFGMNNRGNFWMVAGNTKNAALHEVTYYGVIAR